MTLHFASISELGASYRTGDLSPVDVVNDLLARIDRFGDQTRAYITVVADRARAQAKIAETQLQSGTDLGPLHGIPFALKDLFYTAGICTTSGTKIWRNFVPQESASVVKRLEQAGAILLGKTNMEELAFGPTGLNPHYGMPPNPWHQDHVPGGSSSGSGVAVAAGLTPVALGSDTGGSVRIPASYCGIVGLKPTLERVSRAGVMPLSWTLDSIGPMARCVMDAAMFFETIAGPDGADLVTLGQPDTGVVRWINRDVKQVCVGLVRDPFFEGADPQVVEAVEKAALVLESLGVHVVEMAFPEAREELDDELEGRGSLMIMPVEGLASHRDIVAKHGAEIAVHIKSRLLKGNDFSAVDYAMALQKCTRLRQSAKETLRDVDAVICPTMLTTAPRRDAVDAIPVRLTTRLVNFLGLCAVSLPCGWDKNELPIGLQLIGKPFDEAIILRLAHAFECATDWHKKCPPGF